MGNKLTQQQQSLSESLQDEYFFQSNQFLVHRASQRPCTLHRISTFSRQQSSTVERNVALYQDIKCNSISKLNEYFRLDNSGYCSDHQKFYLVFDGHNSPNIKEQYFSRRYEGQGFTSDEIQSILSCMLCGLRHYKQAFNRKESRISLQSVCINRHSSNLLWLKDPWLNQKQNDLSQVPINFLASYPSPEKIQASNQATFDYDEYKSDLFSIGIFGLQLLGMNFRDDLYVHKKFVDRQKVGATLNTIQNGRLRGGLGILLSEDPNERPKIYRYWDVQCSIAYRINNSHPALHPQNLKSSRVNSYSPQTTPSLTPRQMHQTNYQNNFAVRGPNSLYVSHIAPQPPKNILKTQQGQNPIPRPPSQVQPSAPVPLSQMHNPRPVASLQPYSRAQPSSFNNLQVRPIPSNAMRHSGMQFNAPVDKASLTQQFSKSLEIKSNINDTVNKKKSRIQFSINAISGNANFTKKNAVYFQDSPLKNQRSQSQQAGSTITVKPQTQAANINFTSGNRSNDKAFQSIGKDQVVNKSFETPKFNYQNSSINSNPNTNNKYGFTYMSGSGQSDQQKMLNSFNLVGSSGAEKNVSYPRASQSSNNSPILTRSIISSETAHQNGQFSMPKLSAEENTHIFSNNQSMRQTKHVSQSLAQNGSLTGSFPIFVQNALKEDALEKQSRIEAISKTLVETSPIYQKMSPPTNQPPRIPAQSLISSPIPNPSHAEPQLMSTAIAINQATPPPAVRNPNKYNSTIVEVNEETPNESSQSQNENNQPDIEFIVEQYETGSRYEGFKKNGLRHGRGKFFYQDGGYYDGEWKKNQMHGWGKLYYQGGQLAYEGNWAHDQFHGYGKVYNDNPVKLDTGFDYTNFDLLDDFWEYYEGMLANDTKEGRGRIQLTNKEVFEGDFHADRIQGFGKFLRRDNTIVEGIWRDSRLIKILGANDIHR